MCVLFETCQLGVSLENSQTHRERVREVKEEGKSFGSSCGCRLRDSVADCQIPRLCPSVLRSTSVWKQADWDLNNGGHSVSSDKLFSCSHTVPPSLLLSQCTPLPLTPPSLSNSTITFLHFPEPPNLTTSLLVSPQFLLFP